MNSPFLSFGRHKTRADGMCGMEYASYLAGEKHSDTPASVCPVLNRAVIAFNDALDDVERQKLFPYLPRTIGTRDDGHEAERKRLYHEWLEHHSFSCRFTGSMHGLLERMLPMLPAAPVGSSTITIAQDAELVLAAA